MKHIRQLTRAALGATLLAGTVLTTSCKSTHSSRGKIQPSTFLGDISQLKPGRKGEPKLTYVNPGTDFAKYTKIMLEPIIMVSGDAQANALVNMPKKDRQAIVNYLDAKIRHELSADYTFTKKPGPDTMIVRTALTEAKGSTVVLDTLSSILPPAAALSAVKEVATGAATAVGEAAVEGEIKDSVTGERLAASVDARVGAKYTGHFDKFNRYHAVHDAIDYWTKDMKQRLAKARRGEL